MASPTAVMSAWSFEIEPARFDEIVRHVKQSLEHVPKVPGWMGTDCFANEKRSRVMILSKWESKDAWGSSMWDDVLGRTLADVIELSRTQHFELYFQIAP